MFFEGKNSSHIDWNDILESLNIPAPLPEWSETLFLTVYVVVIVIAAFGNVAVLIVLGKNLSERTVTDIFLMSLAVSDLTIALVNMPFHIYYILTNTWTLGIHMCRFVNYTQAVTIISSIFTLTTVALDRYILICHLPKWRFLKRKKRAIVTVSVIWLLSLVLMIPQAVIMTVLPSIGIVPGSSLPRIIYKCQETFINDTWMTAYEIYIYTVFYVIPTLIMIVSYAAIGHKLWLRPAVGDIRNSALLARQERHKKKVIKMMLAVVIAFILCWFPFFTFQLCARFLTTKREYYTLAKILFQLFGYLNTCINPILYTFLHSHFLDSLTNILCCRIEALPTSFATGGTSAGNTLPVSLK
ncbi:QRFP-like peptide receptor [Tubulanus polymorphus]|uniref:QRFP-like peptide receptor n=1 Tax=Tubulanus polymorphus TaxID=672921 RepID=UPI003DA35F66